MTRIAEYGSAAWRRWKHDHHWAAVGTVDPLGAGNTALIGASGLNVTPLAFYDVRKNITLATGVSSLGDVSGAGTYGPALVQATTTQQPTWNGTTINFDGSTQWLLSATSVAGLLLSNALTVALVADVSGAAGGTAFYEVGGPSRTPHLFVTRQSATPFDWQVNVDNGRSATPPLAGTTAAVRLAIASVSGGASPTVSLEVPTVAKVTSPTGPAESSAACSIALGATVTGVALAAIKFRALIAWSGGYTTGQRDTLETWATTYHGAVMA